MVRNRARLDAGEQPRGRLTVVGEEEAPQTQEEASPDGTFVIASSDSDVELVSSSDDEAKPMVKVGRCYKWVMCESFMWKFCRVLLQFCSLAGRGRCTSDC